jgi:hypothetical protein
MHDIVNKSYRIIDTVIQKNGYSLISFSNKDHIIYLGGDSLNVYLILRNYLEPKKIDTLLTGIRGDTISTLIGSIYNVQYNLNDSLLVLGYHWDTYLIRIYNKNCYKLLREFPDATRAKFTQDGEELVMIKGKEDPEGQIPAIIQVYDIKTDSLRIILDCLDYINWVLKSNKGQPTYYIKQTYQSWEKNLFSCDDKGIEKQITFFDTTQAKYFDRFFMAGDSIICELGNDTADFNVIYKIINLNQIDN